ncbi:lipopolysaccharide heptosyltransferase II [Aquabacter sp. L1I39]|uniref:lipopolysaccharide heptosyltransferase II n=1 Tax=Aquabacter sp. L1I39 TaxID=2820278 RepID=UPI001AD9D3D1|nr:lipopolysaccharide heptosyltransferase II [Aquabacter sp. L1I39]QTL02566.1 lipopolysaccharide heptosyltransferase II [Aquabacter sp. L1I39]
MSFVVPAQEKNRQTKEPILVAGYGGIGDHVRCFALVRHVAATHPGAPIDFLCRSPTDRVVRFVPELRKAYVDDTPHGRFGLKEKLDLAGRLRREGYRRVYVVSRTMKAAIVPFLAGIPERVGWFGEGRALLINRIRTGERGYPGETEKICGLAGPASGTCLPPRLVVPPQELHAWQDRTLGGAPRGPVLALAPGAYNPHRLWPPAYFADLARRFVEQGWEVWVLGGPQERQAAAEIAAHVPVRDFTGVPLEEAVLQIRSASLFVGNDSGMLHLAGAIGTPSVGLFGPTTAEVSGPRNPNVHAVRPPTGHVSVDKITVDGVEKAIRACTSQSQLSIGAFSFSEQ